MTHCSLGLSEVSEEGAEEYSVPHCPQEAATILRARGGPPYKYQMGAHRGHSGSPMTQWILVMCDCGHTAAQSAGVKRGRCLEASVKGKSVSDTACAWDLQDPVNSAKGIAPPSQTLSPTVIWNPPLHSVCESLITSLTSLHHPSLAASTLPHFPIPALTSSFYPSAWSHPAREPEWPWRCQGTNY